MTHDNRESLTLFGAAIILLASIVMLLEGMRWGG